MTAAAGSLEVLDLFSGAAGGWSLGLHRAGFRTVAACEIDPVRRAVYRQNNPGVILYDDVRTLSAARLLRDLGFLPDIIVGSPPCQDISSANTKGKGVDGARSGLFFEAVRIVGECRPRWVALENSPFVRTRGYDRIADGLEALGYACWPFVVGADDIGANHKRKRAWIVAADPSGRGAGSGPDIAQPEPAACNSDLVDANGHPGRLGASAEAIDGHGPAGQLAALERAVGPTIHAWNGGVARHLGVAHGLSARLAGLRVPDFKHPPATINAAKACIAAYGDAVLPQIPEAIGHAILRVERALQVVSGNISGRPAS